jgi:Zn-dependent protease with chaperone function
LFYDGLTAEPQPILRLAITVKGIKFQTAKSGIKFWAFDRINWDLSSLDAKPVRIHLRDNEDTSLTLRQASTIPSLRAMRQLNKNTSRLTASPETKTILRATVTTLGVFLLLWFLWPFLADKLAARVPEEPRVWLKHMAEDEYTNKGKFCRNAEAEQALATLETRLTSHHPALRDVAINVIDSKSVNAFALPGREIIVTSGILKQAQSGDEIAGVIAHELGHVEHDHNMRAVLQRLPVTLVVALLGSNLNSMSKLADFFIEAAHSRKFEAEADATALALLRDAQISAKGFGDFFQREKGVGGVLKYASTHPLSSERAAIIAATPEPPDPRPALTPSEWQSLQGICGPKPAPIPKQPQGSQAI